MSAEKKAAPKKPGKRKRKPKEGLFDDLEDTPDHEIDERATALRASIRATEKEHEVIQQERQAMITLVQSLRQVHEATRGISKERTTLLNQFRGLRSKADSIRAERDAINTAVPPPLEVIEQRLAQTYRRLATLPNDLVRMPNRDHEIQLFSFFFELQAMHVRKAQGNALHQAYIDLLRGQEEKLKGLDQLSADKQTIAEDAREEIADQKANPKEIRQLNNRIGEMLETVRTQRGSIKKLRREAGRLEACLRVRKKAPRAARGRYLSLRLDEVKARASSGGTLSIDDFSALLKGGGLGALTGDKPEAKEKSTRESVKPRKRQVGAARGRRRAATQEERERRRG